MRARLNWWIDWERGEARSEGSTVRFIRNATGGFGFDILDRTPGMTDAEIAVDLQQALDQTR